MPEPAGPSTQADARVARRTAIIALIIGIVLMGTKLCIFMLTGSAAVLSDALESVVNLAAAGLAIFSTWYAARPPDEDHPYGHGNVEFIAIAIEGLLVATAGVTIAYESIGRLRQPTQLNDLDTGAIALAVTAVCMAGLAGWVWGMGRRINSPTLIADGKHLMTDVLTTVSVLIGLVLVQFTGMVWLDSVLALVVAGVVFITGGRLMYESWLGLSCRADPKDDQIIRKILDNELAAGRIAGYHKVRYRHVGTFHWIDMHIQVDQRLTVRQGHEIASAIEHRIEQALSPANATAHVEPA